MNRSRVSRWWLLLAVLSLVLLVLGLVEFLSPEPRYSEADPF